VLARSRKDFAVFAPVLQEWIEIKRERGRLIDAARPLYDVLADEYAQGMTSARITAIFDDVKHDLAPFLLHLKKHGKRPDVKCLQGNFDVKAQEALGRDIATAIGFDFTKGRLDTSVHPCTFGIHSSDVRITTRYRADDAMEALTGTIHEVGHALYEQGLHAAHDGLLVDRACGMAMHESQSLLWERMVLLGLPFARFLLPKLQNAFPDSGFGGVDARGLYKACNAIVDQSFIRVEADEVMLIAHLRRCPADVIAMRITVLCFRRYQHATHRHHHHHSGCLRFTILFT
jgi:carboxypeptidase Taq